MIVLTSHRVCTMKNIDFTDFFNVFLSGATIWFVLGFISLFFLLRGKSLAAGTVITIIADAYCFYTAYVHPERITYMESESVVYGDIIVSAVITIFLTCAFMFIQITLSEYQRKENEKQQAELVAAMNTQSRFLANMSHEIRTPINTIIGLNEMTLREEKTILLRMPIISRVQVRCFCP